MRNVRHVCDGDAALREQAGDGALSDVDAELEEFAMDSGSTPQGIGRGHSSDQGFDRGVDGRVARRAAPGERGPVAAKAASLSAQHSGGSHDDEGLLPGGPDSGQPDPKEPIAPLKLRPVRRPLVDGQLLPQGEVLEGELAVAAAQEREESEQMEQEDDHWAKIFSGSEQTDQPLAHRTEFWRRTGWPSGATVSAGCDRGRDSRGGSPCYRLDGRRHGRNYSIRHAAPRPTAH